MADKYSLSREQIIDLLENVLDTKIANGSTVKKNIMFCCTVHGESNPSAGFNVDKQVFNCLSCHATGGVSWLLYKSQPDTFKSVQEADEFIADRYDVDLQKFDQEWKERGIRRFDDLDDDDSDIPVRFVQSRVKLAPFKSGKETFEYFFDRGFDKQDIIKYKIGRDLIMSTVTIPVFWENGDLCGIVGRKIDPRTPSGYRYHVYDFPKSSLLYPLNHYKSDRRRAILVEGHLDAMWLHKLGYPETLALQTNKLSRLQAQWIVDHCDEVIDFTDNDEMGEEATSTIKANLKGKGVKILSYKHLYPAHAKDPMECSVKELKKILASTPLNEKVPKIKRL